MLVKHTKINDVLIIVPDIHEDARGYFFEAFNKEKFREATGVDFNPVQTNESRSTFGTVRGLHFQRGDYAQAKLVRVVRGVVNDVAVDLRKSSPTYGQWVAVTLTDTAHNQLFIPRGFAHGFSMLSEDAVFEYLVDAPYNKESEDGIAWDSPALDIDWEISDKFNPFIGDMPVLSEKDRNRPDFDPEKDYFD